MIFRHSLFLACALVVPFVSPALAEESSVTAKPAQTFRKSISRGWLIQETENFRICSLPSTKLAEKLPDVCEELRTHLQQTWFGEPSWAWPSRCEIVVHESTTGYAAALGPGSEQSSGCASFNFESGKVVGRRIDLRADANDWFDSALPHELTHVVLADRFTRGRIPRWADEGMAILIEPMEKQRRRREALERGIIARKEFTARELTGLIDYPASDRRDPFYSQSASLVSFLIERDSPERFLEFLELAATGNRLSALKEVYGFADWQALEAAWRPRLLTRGESAELLAQRAGRITSPQALD